VTVSGIKVEGYIFHVEYDVIDIKRVYLGHGGYDVWPILANRVRLKIFDEIFKNL